MNPKLKTRLESLGFRQTGTITLGKREIPVFGMKMMKDTRKADAGQVQPNGQGGTPMQWSEQ